MVFIESSACFLAIPEGPGFEAVRKAVTEALDQFQVRSLDLGTLSPHSKAPNISDTVERVDFVIADVTSESADIFYQLGVADALRKPTLMMAQKQVSLPGDLGNHQLLLYGPEEVSKLVEYLRYWIPDVIAMQRQRNAPIKSAS
jgi:hypothetical protein